MQFQISCRSKSSVKRHLSHRKLDFFEKISLFKFALSDVADNNLRLLNRGGKVDLPLLKTLVVIYQK